VAEHDTFTRELTGAAVPMASRLLCWIYSRAGEQLTCELALDRTARLYELRSWRARQPASTRIEKFLDVTSAFVRQSHMEGALIADGWTLEGYQSVNDPRESGPAQ
jgi:hypothetical protein